MLDFEYDNIINKYCKKFDITFSDERKEDIINLYNMLADKTKLENLDFESLCEQIFLNEYLTERYPKLNLYDTLFSPWGCN